jgi:hypothetical protein
MASSFFKRNWCSEQYFKGVGTGAALGTTIMPGWNCVGGVGQ